MAAGRRGAASAVDFPAILLAEKSSSKSQSNRRRVGGSDCCWLEKNSRYAALRVADAGCARGAAHRRIACRGVSAGGRDRTPASKGRFARARHLDRQIVRGAARALAVIVNGVE